MDLLPKRNERPSVPHSPANKGARPPVLEVPTIAPTRSLHSSPAVSSLSSSPVRAWIVFAPSVLLILALIAAFRTGGLEPRSCGIAIGMVITLYNVGSFVQNLLYRVIPGIRVMGLVVQAFLPVVGLFGLLVWLQPTSASGFYNEALQLGLLVVALAAGDDREGCAV